jgi:hypothetical protein
MPFVNEVNRTGGMLEQRGASMLEDYDTTQAYAAFNQLRTTSRQKLNELLSREGSRAYGSQAEYNEYYKKTKEEVSNGSITAYSQRRKFDALADNHKESDLDSLARHEYVEDKKNKKTQFQGYFANEESFARDNAANDKALNNSLYGEFVTGEDGKPTLKTPGVWQAIDHFHPGLDTEALKIKAAEDLRYAALDRLIAEDPKYAAKKLEDWKSELGEKYASLKKRLESQTKSDNLERAYVMVTDKFGANYEAAAAFVNNPKNWSELGGIKFEEASTLNTRINGLRAQREAQESSAQEHMHRTQEANASKMIADLNQTIDPVKRQQLLLAAPEMLRTQKISIASFNAITKEVTEGVKQDDLMAIEQLDDALARKVDVSSMSIQFFNQGRIKSTTADNYVKAGKKAPIAEGHDFIKTSLDPGLMGTPDARVAAGEAVDYYYHRLRDPNPPDPIALSREVVKSYSTKMKRTLAGSRIPTYMPKGASIKDPVSLSQALDATQQAYKSGLMGNPDDQRTIDKYNEEFDHVMTLYNMATRTVMVDEGLKDADVQKGVEASRKAGNKY